jgi:hypothetical protein
MELSEKLKMKRGRWLVGNCGNLPSEKNCKLVIMAPEDQREDILDASIVHAVKSHGHQDTPELRGELNKLLEIVEL